MKRFFFIYALLFCILFRVLSQNFEIIQLDVPKNYYGSIDTIDFNKDGFLDIAFTGSDGSSNTQTYQTSILINKGNFLFTNKIQNIPGTVAGTLRTVDYNNDGLVDVFVKGFKGIMFSTLFKNTGDTLVELYNFPYGLASGDAKWADLDNDGYKDLVMLGNGYFDNGLESYTKVFKNNGDDSFIEKTTNFINENSASIDLTDFNNDGLDDILIVGGTGIFKLYKNLGNFSFSEINTGIDGVKGSGAFFESNSDSLKDIIYGGTNNSDISLIQVVENIGDTVFKPKTFKFKALSNPHFAFEDFNNDNKHDIIISGTDNNTKKCYTLLYLNYKDSISLVYIDSVNAIEGEIKVADFDNDGKIDFVVSGYNLATGKNNTILYKNISSQTTVANINESFFEFNTYPNPTDDKINITFRTHIKTHIKIDVIDLNGRIIQNLISKKFNIGEQKLLFSTNLNNGLYLIKMELEGNVYYNKIYISHNH